MFNDDRLFEGYPKKRNAIPMPKAIESIALYIIKNGIRSVVGRIASSGATQSILLRINAAMEKIIAIRTMNSFLLMINRFILSI